MEEELHDEEMEEEDLEEEEEGTDGGVSEDTDTPTGVQTPETGGEGGSTGDEMEMHQRSLAFGNKVEGLIIRQMFCRFKVCYM